MAGIGWMIYGAYGYTGRLVAASALRRGHHPVLAGRSESPLRLMAEELGLDYWVVSVDDQSELVRALEDVQTVVNLAGPFTRTAVPIAEACIAAGTNYVDVAGDLPVPPMLFALDHRARDAGIVVLPSAGWDAVPTNCMAGMLQKELPDATWLELAKAARGKGSWKHSGGTLRSAIESMGRREPVLVRREGRLVEPEWAPTIRIPFPVGELKVSPRTRVDLDLAYRATGIPNIVYYSPGERGESLARWVAGMPGGVSLLKLLVRRTSGPDASERAATSTYVWARVWNERGESAGHVLTTPSGYAFTADALTRVVDRLRRRTVQPGTHTPLSALGDDFVLECDGVRLD